MVSHERSLLEEFRSGDPQAVRGLYERYGGSVYAVAYRMLGDPGLAEEATQLTFIKAWRSAAQLDLSRDPAPWLYTIARRAAIDLYRRERRHIREPLPDLAAVPDSAESTWAVWQVRQAVEELPKAERDVVYTTHFLGYSHEETADRLRIPVGTVKSRSHRAHRRLAAHLGRALEATA